jgi:nicotinate-nucleotide adenylyltransferase
LKPSGKRLGFLGGTFDPIHLGHLQLARLAIAQRRLDTLYFLPAFAPPHKEGRKITDFAARVEMLRLATIGEEKMAVCLLEEHLPPPSYTSKTLRHLQERFAGCELSFVIGSDSFFDLPSWHDYEEIIATAHLLVAARRGCADLSIMAGRLGYQIMGDRWQRPGKKDIFILSGQVAAVSSSDLRAALRRGEECPLLPPAVADRLRERRLYRG